MPKLDFNDSELIEYLEIALVALMILPVQVGETMDLSEEYIIETIRGKLHLYLNEPMSNS